MGESEFVLFDKTWSQDIGGMYASAAGFLTLAIRDEQCSFFRHKCAECYS